MAELEAVAAELSGTAAEPTERLEALTRVLAVSDRLHAAAVGLVGEVAADPATAAADGLGVAGFLERRDKPAWRRGWKSLTSKG